MIPKSHVPLSSSAQCYDLFAFTSLPHCSVYADFHKRWSSLLYAKSTIYIYGLLQEWYIIHIQWNLPKRTPPNSQRFFFWNKLPTKSSESRHLRITEKRIKHLVSGIQSFHCRTVSVLGDIYIQGLFKSNAITQLVTLENKLENCYWITMLYTIIINMYLN